MSKIPNRKLAERALEHPVVQDAVRGLAREDAVLHVAMCYKTLGPLMLTFEREHPDEDYELAANPMEVCVAAVMMINEGKAELVYDEYGDVVALIKTEA